LVGKREVIPAACGFLLPLSQFRRVADKYELSIESRALKGGPATTAISFPFSREDWTWSPDGRIIASVPDPANSNRQSHWRTPGKKQTLNQLVWILHGPTERDGR
jgi:hypothetical protein